MCSELPTSSLEDSVGVLLVDKPAGFSSFAMVRMVRRLTGVRKVGHAGTLDPFATGLLVVCIGRPATKLVGELMGGSKSYLATLTLGRTSSTHDPEGEILQTDEWPLIPGPLVHQVLESFRGEIMQVPPAFSALKHRGKPLYHYARRGIIVEKAARPVCIHRLQWLDERDILDQDNPTLNLVVCCSKGTYIRTLAADIGAALRCGAYLSALRRIGSGCFSVEQAVSGAALAGADGEILLREALIDRDEVRKRLHSSAKEDSITCYG